MRVRVIHHIDDLVADMARITMQTKPKMAAVVRRNALAGEKLWERIARAKSGPHGRHFHKRIESQMVTPLTWHFGPTDLLGTSYVGAGYRHGTNTDLAQTDDVIKVKFRKDVDKVIGDLFW